MAVACRDVEAVTLAHDGSPPITRTTFPTCRAHYPGGSSGCACRLLPRSCSLPQMAGEACSGFTYVTARRIAQPPKAAFVTRLQPFRLASRAARQLPDQSTTLWVESSSTGDPRLRGALPKADLGPLMLRISDGPPTPNKTNIGWRVPARPLPTRARSPNGWGAAERTRLCE